MRSELVFSCHCLSRKCCGVQEEHSDSLSLCSSGSSLLAHYFAQYGWVLLLMACPISLCVHAFSSTCPPGVLSLNRGKLSLISKSYQISTQAMSSFWSLQQILHSTSRISNSFGFPPTCLALSISY